MILSGKNSGWCGYIYKEFNTLFGAGITNWKKKEDNADPVVMEQWQKDQALPMMVYVQNGNDWKYVDYFSLVVDTASRNMIMELDLSSIKEETVNIKLETVYRFWHLDYAALEFSENDIGSSVYINVAKADREGSNEKNNLVAKDKQYTYLTGVQAIGLEFNPPVIDKNLTSPFFLVSSFYYHSLKKYEGKAKTMELLQFRTKGAFTAFSRKKYNDINADLEKFLVRK